MKKGDRVRLVNRTRLKDVSIATHEGSTAILDLYHYWPKIGDGWYFELEGTKIYLWSPSECLELIDERTQTNEMSEMKEGGCYNGNCKETKPTITKKEQTTMYLHTVTIIKQPSTLAQQAGEIETIIVPSTEVMANDTTSAVAQVAADNAEAITPLKGKSTIRVVVKQIA